MNEQCFILMNLCLDHCGWQSSPFLPYTFGSGLGCMHVSPLQPGEGGQGFGEEAAPHPQSLPQERLSHPVVVPTTLHQPMEESEQEIQVRQLKLNEISPVLGISQSPQRRKLLGAQKSWVCWINSPGKGCGEERQQSAPDAQIYPSDTLHTPSSKASGGFKRNK